MGVYYVAGVPFGDELYHHGIKGQKWGIRRFQNEDGSLTEEGKRQRYTSKDARADLGFKEKGHLNSVQKHLTSMYKADVNAAKKAALRGDKALAKGKDPTKHYNRGMKFYMSSLSYKVMAKSYSSLSTKEQKKINRGMNFVKAAGFYLARGLGVGTYEQHLYERNMKSV